MHHLNFCQGFSECNNQKNLLLALLESFFCHSATKNAFFLCKLNSLFYEIAVRVNEQPIDDVGRVQGVLLLL